MKGVGKIVRVFVVALGISSSSAFLSSLSKNGNALLSATTIEEKSFLSERKGAHSEGKIRKQLTNLFAAMEVWSDSRFSEKPLPDKISVDALLDTVRDESAVGLEVSRFVVEQTKDQRYDRILLNGKLVGMMVNITEENGQQTALAAVGSVEWIVAYAEGDEQWKMIPAENLIGAATQTGTKICFMVERVQDVVGLSQALQVGVDALCVPSDAPQELWDAVIKAKKQRKEQAASNPQKTNNSPKESEEHESIVGGKCWRTPTSGSGTSVVADRVCIDMVQALEPTEGCWIGSSAKIMSLVLSEAAASSFVPTRPFRVNAGPVHSYVCLGDGIRTKYLCELQAGDEVLVYNAATEKSRSVAVGRLKVEVRPCVLVSLQEVIETATAAGDGKPPAEGQIFLQQAETVRLGKEGGDFVRVTDLEVASSEEPGEHIPILLRITSTGTHVGGRYEGKVAEM